MDLVVSTHSEPPGFHPPTLCLDSRPSSYAYCAVRNRGRLAEPCGQPVDPGSRDRLALTCLLDLRRRPATDRRLGARRRRDCCVAVPVHRHDHLHDPPAAGVHRGPSRAGPRDQGVRAPPAASQRDVLRALRAPDRARLAALSRVPAPAQGPVPLLQQAGRPALVRVPLLRDARRPPPLLVLIFFLVFVARGQPPPLQ